MPVARFHEINPFPVKWAYKTGSRPSNSFIKPQPVSVFVRFDSLAINEYLDSIVHIRNRFRFLVPKGAYQFKETSSAGHWKAHEIKDRFNQLLSVRNLLAEHELLGLLIKALRQRQIYMKRTRYEFRSNIDRYSSSVAIQNTIRFLKQIAEGK